MKNNTDNTLMIVITIILAIFLFGGFGMMGFGGMGMMGNYGFGYGSIPIFGSIIIILILIPLILFIIWIVKQLSKEEGKTNGRRR